MPGATRADVVTSGMVSMFVLEPYYVQRLARAGDMVKGARKAVIQSLGGNQGLQEVIFFLGKQRGKALLGSILQ